MAQVYPSVTIVIPAHNEEAGLRRLLPLLLVDAERGEFKVLVVCNGCTDGSADEARKHGADVEVLELDQASKAAALEAGGARVLAFPIAFVDADVAIDTASMRALVTQVGRAGTLAAGPNRRLERESVSRVSGWYYDIWERLPQVRSGLFGRGVIVLSEPGFRRVAQLPHFISDDLAFSESFQPSERAIVSSAVVSVWPARTWGALLKRRVRVVQGNREFSKAVRLSPEAATSVSDLLRIVRKEPQISGRLAIFVATAIIARFGARVRRRDPAAWLRDETSRAA